MNTAKQRKKEADFVVSAFLAEKHEHHQGIFFGGVFVVGNLRKAPSGRELGML